MFISRRSTSATIANHVRRRGPRRGIALALRDCVPVRFTTIALAIVMLLGTTAAAESSRTARVIVAGSLAPAPLGSVELGLFGSDRFYVHVDGAIAYDYAASREDPGVGGGLDLMWGTKTLGYAGPCFAYLGLRFVVLRIGFESPVSHHVAIRGWLAAGAAEEKDETLPYGSLNLGVAWRL
jgi:hypothetical protein